MFTVGSNAVNGPTLQPLLAHLSHSVSCVWYRQSCSVEEDMTETERIKLTW